MDFLIYDSKTVVTVLKQKLTILNLKQKGHSKYMIFLDIAVKLRNEMCLG